ncbi:MAG TPA: alpha/beta hydrolase [Planktothrix sp.]
MRKYSLPLSMLAVTFALIYVTMCPRLNPWLIDGIMFHPYTEIDTNQIKSIRGIAGREITFGNGLTGWFYQVPNSHFVILFSHGNAGNLSHRVNKIAPLLACHQSVFIWDYAGFGHSKGLATRATIANDANDAYEALIHQGYKPEQIILYGESLGTGVNAEIMKLHKVKAVIIDSGFTSLECVAKEKMPIFRLYPSFLLPPPTMLVRDQLGDTPCLIIHGKSDEIIPYHNAEDLHAADKNSTLITLSKSSHNYIDSADATLIQAALREFLAKLSAN